MSNNAPLYSAHFKRDFMAYLAIVLFGAIVISEIVVAMSLPLLVKQKDLWTQHASKLELLALFDDLRNTLGKEINNKNESIAGEAGLLMAALDETAIYLRRYAQRMNMTQMQEVMEELRRIAPLRYRLNEEKLSHSNQENINIIPFLKQLEQQIENNNTN